MNIPVIRGTIARRLLVNFRADPREVQQLLPRPFRPKLHGNHAIVGVCLIRLERIRPAWSPLTLGLSSENAAHRIAVEWDESDGTTREGVFIPRRDSGSRLNSLLGGRLFPGQHHFAAFQVREDGDEIELQMRSQDEVVEVQFAGKVAPQLPATSCFSSLDEASRFFQRGSLGYSVRRDSQTLDGLTLESFAWRVEALEASAVSSSFYRRVFARGGLEYDHTLLMRGIEHRWHAAPPMTTITSNS